MRYRGPPFLLDTIAAAARPLAGRRVKCGRRATSIAPGSAARRSPPSTHHPPRAQPRGGGSGGETEAFPAGERSPSPPGLRGFGRSAHLPGTRRADRALAHSGARHPRGRDTWRLTRPVPDLPLPPRRPLGCKELTRGDPRPRGAKGSFLGLWIWGWGSEFVTPPSARRCAVLSAPAR